MQVPTRNSPRRCSARPDEQLAPLELMILTVLSVEELISLHLGVSHRAQRPLVSIGAPYLVTESPAVLATNGKLLTDPETFERLAGGGSSFQISSPR